MFVNIITVELHIKNKIMEIKKHTKHQSYNKQIKLARKFV